MDALKVRDWLTNPKSTFAEGRDLYNKFKSSPKLDKMLNSAASFERGTIQFNILVGELNRIFRILQQRTAAEIKIVEVTGSLINTKKITLGEPQTVNQRRAASMQVTNHNPSVDYNLLPDEMKAKFDTIKELSKTIGGLKAVTVDKQASAVDRKDAADELCRQFDTRAELWKELDVWGKANPEALEGDNSEELSPEKKKAVKKKRDEINRSINNLVPKDDAKREAKIKRLEQEIAEIEADGNA